MPSISDHLQWLEIRDFSAGLWTANAAHLMPGNAFQVMTDCYPQPGGGVRAWFVPTNINVTGLPASGEKVVGIAAQALGYTGSGGGTALDLAYLLVTRVVSTGQLKAYYKPVNSTTFTLSKTFAAPGNPNPGDQCQLLTYENTGGNRLWVLGHFSYPNGYPASSDTGTWTFNGSTWTRISPIYGPPMAVYQQRLFVTLANTIYWTDPGGTVFPPANYLEIDTGFRDISSTPKALAPFSPSTLAIPTTGGNWLTIDGDISDPVVREMGYGRYPSSGSVHAIAVANDGIWFYEPNHGYYLAQNMGSTFAYMSPQLDPPVDEEAVPHSMLVYDDWLICADGRIYDMTVGCWFTSSYLQTNLVKTMWDNIVHGVLLGEFKTGFSFKVLRTKNAGTRASSYTLKTAPLRHPDGRQIVIREVEVACRSFNTAATIAVTVGGVTRTSPALGTGSNVVKFGFPSRREEYLDVQVVASSNTTSEAPMIEVIRVGTRSDGHRLR